MEIGAITLRLIYKNEINPFILLIQVIFHIGNLRLKSDSKQHDLPYDKLAEAKKEKENLGKLENHIIKIFYLDNNDGFEISKDWLK